MNLHCLMGCNWIVRHGQTTAWQRPRPFFGWEAAPLLGLWPRPWQRARPFVRGEAPELESSQSTF